MNQVGSPQWQQQDRHLRAWYFVCACPLLHWVPAVAAGYCPECKQTRTTGILFTSERRKQTAQAHALRELSSKQTWEAIFLF